MTNDTPHVDPGASSTQAAERILVFTPTGRDAPLACEVLNEAGLPTTACPTTEAFYDALTDGAGAALVAEEAATRRLVRLLRRALAQRPPWSDLPIVLLASADHSVMERPELVNKLAPRGNITVLERPVRRATLVTIMQAALRARQRQYEVRDLLARLQAKNDALEQEVERRKDTEASLAESQEALRQANEQLEARVAERTAQVRRLSAALTKAEQRERKRIAQVLHDDLQQQLHGIKIWAQVLTGRAEGDIAPDERDDLLERIDAGLDDAIETTRTLSSELSPPLSSGENLGDALRWLAMHMEDTYGLTVTMDAYEESHLINEDRRILTFQIVRELLFNVVKHAEADEARVALSRQDSTCVIQVEDDGVGFDPSILQDQQGEQTGFGLSSLRERLDLIGGDLRAIDSEPGAGTRITIAIPTEAARAEA